MVQVKPEPEMATNDDEAPCQDGEDEVTFVIRCFGHACYGMLRCKIVHTYV